GATGKLASGGVAGGGYGDHALTRGGNNASRDSHPTRRRRGAPGGPAQNPRGAAQAVRRAALSLLVLRTQRGIFPRCKGNVGRPPAKHEARAGDPQRSAEPSRGMVERL